MTQQKNGKCIIVKKSERLEKLAPIIRRHFELQVRLLKPDINAIIEEHMLVQQLQKEYDNEN